VILGAAMGHSMIYAALSSDNDGIVSARVVDEGRRRGVVRGRTVHRSRPAPGIVSPTSPDYTWVATGVEGGETVRHPRRREEAHRRSLTGYAPSREG
jgi:hypothetical protein